MANAKAAIELLDDDNDNEVQDVTVSDTTQNDRKKGDGQFLLGYGTMEPFQQNDFSLSTYNHPYSFPASTVARRQPKFQSQFIDKIEGDRNFSTNSMVIGRPQYGQLLSAQSQMYMNRTHVVSLPVFDSSQYKPDTYGRSTSTEALFIPYSIKDALWDCPNRLHSSSSKSGIEEYKLSLISVSEFTVRGISKFSYMRPPSISWMRIHIRKISKPHGKAIFERFNTSSEENDENTQNSKNDIGVTNNKDLEDDEMFDDVDGGRWRIPLGAYQSFYSWLSSHSQHCLVHGIPPQQLKIASLGKDRRDRQYPNADKLIKLGVPRGLAWALAPYQRGGVDFVIERGGKALIGM